MIVHGLDAVPEGLNVVVASRSEPPPQLARLRANDRIGLIGWQEIKLTKDEAREIMQAHGVKDMKADALAEIHQQTDGWAAGLILMREMLKAGSGGLRDQGSLGRDDIFNYYSRELLGKTDDRMRDFLLRTALLPRITAVMAHELTGTENADRILEDLNRNQFFTQKHVQDGAVYQYHPLFREFLRSGCGTVEHDRGHHCGGQEVGDHRREPGRRKGRKEGKGTIFFRLLSLWSGDHEGTDAFPPPGKQTGPSVINDRNPEEAQRAQRDGCRYGAWFDASLRQKTGFIAVPAGRGGSAAPSPAPGRRRTSGRPAEVPAGREGRTGNGAIVRGRFRRR
jgi:hypothetical protein